MFSSQALALLLLLSASLVIVQGSPSPTPNVCGSDFECVNTWGMAGCFQGSCRCQIGYVFRDNHTHDFTCERLNCTSAADKIVCESSQLDPELTCDKNDWCKCRTGYVSDDRQMRCQLDIVGCNATKDCQDQIMGSVCRSDGQCTCKMGYIRNIDVCSHAVCNEPNDCMAKWEGTTCDRITQRCICKKFKSLADDSLRCVNSFGDDSEKHRLFGMVVAIILSTIVVIGVLAAAAYVTYSYLQSPKTSNPLAPDAPSVNKKIPSFKSALKVLSNKQPTVAMASSRGSKKDHKSDSIKKT